MSQQKTVIRTPAKSEISTHLLCILIFGYVRSIVDPNSKLELPNDIEILFVNYYPKQLYFMLLNNKTLQVTFCNTERNDTKLTLNKGIILNDDYEDDGFTQVGICEINQDEKLKKLSSKITNEIKNWNGILSKRFCI